MSMKMVLHSKIRTLGHLAVSSLVFSGCFNNLSGLGNAFSSSQSNGVQLNDSGFAGETGTIDTSAVLIGTYNNTGGSGFGILIDLQKSLTATLGATTLQLILDQIDGNTAMQARPLVIHFPTFGIKASTTLGKVAAGNSKKLRNVMNIRPNMTRIDLTTSALEIPGSPSVLQLANSNKTVITYGGKIEGDYLRRMTLLIPFAGVNASFLPSISNPNYGDGYPTASPDELPGSVKLVKLTAAGNAIATHFGKMMTNPPYGVSITNGVQSDAIKSISQTKDSLALAIHLAMNADGSAPLNCPVISDVNLLQGGCNLDGTRKINAAYIININPSNTAGPETFPYCHSGYDSQDQTVTYNTDGYADFSHPLACNCPLSGGCHATLHNGAGPGPTTAQFVDPWPAAKADQNPSLLKAAIDAAALFPAPTSGTIPLSSAVTVNDFVLSSESDIFSKSQ